MNEGAEDLMHKILEELISLGIVSNSFTVEKMPNWKCPKCKGSGKKICYGDFINKTTESNIVFLIGHELGHLLIMQNSKLVLGTIIMSAIVEFSILVSLIGYPSYLLYFVLIFIITAIILFQFLLPWLQQDEYLSDLYGAYILIKYGKNKGLTLYPSAVMKDLFSFLENCTEKRRYLKFLNRLDVHPKDSERIKRLVLFEEFYYSIDHSINL